MANGVFLHDEVVANDILYADFKVYHNYDTPKEQLVGVARGGCVIDIPKDIHEIMADSTYGVMLDEDGVPMIRTNKVMPKINLQMLYLKYFNIKNISDAESTDNWESNDWAANGGTYAAETTIYQTGIQSAKCTADTSAYGIHNVFSSTVDLTAYSNGETSTTADKIAFSIYITTQDKTDLGSADIRLKFHMDAEGTETNHYYYDIAASALTANRWNNFTIAKSSFTEVGTGNWATVTGISFSLDAAPSAEVVFYVDSISMLMTITDDTDAFAAPLEKQGGNWSYTNETTYKKYTPKIAIENEDYLDNLTIIGGKHDGKMVKWVLRNCYNDGNLALAMGEKDEVVADTQYTAHYEPTKGTTIPFEMYEYV